MRGVALVVPLTLGLAWAAAADCPMAGGVCPIGQSLMQVQFMREKTPPVEEAPGVVALGNCTLFTLYEYPSGAPDFVQLNLESWQRHARGLCGGPVLINDSNVRQYIPDIPVEFFRLHYQAAKADMVRYALVARHGGIYMDTDVLVVRDLGPIIQQLQRYDLVSYESDGQHCRGYGSFSSNFLGGRKGSEILGKIWAAQKAKVTEHCVPGEGDEHRLCCYDQEEELPCHVPWGSIGERTSHPVVRALLRDEGQRIRDKLFCLGGTESFVPSYFVEVLEHAPLLQDGLALWASRGVEAPLDRTAYHLFNAISGYSGWQRSDFFNETAVLGELYRRSFAMLAGEPPSSQLAAVPDKA